MKAYGEYRDTAEFWLPPLPAHWDFQKIKRLFSERIEKGYPKKPLLAATQNKGVVLKKDYGSRTVEATKDLHLLKLVCCGDFVISLRSFQGGIEYANTEGIISPAYTIMTPIPKIRCGYFKYFAKIPCFIDLLNACVTGIREGQNIDYKKLREHLIPIPPREEQDQIVRYLDAKVSKINKIIKIKQQQIALLKEKKQAIINQAVTKGIAPNAPMKDSGVAWIGEIPEGWEVVQFSRVIVGITQGWSPVASNGERQEGQWGVLTLSAINDGEFFPAAVKPIPLNISVNKDLELKQGDFLLTRSNTRLLVGDVCIVDVYSEKLIPSDLIYKLTTTNNIKKQYLLYLMKSFIGRQQIEQSAHGSSGTMPKLTHRHIKNWKILLPSTEEQIKITHYISKNILAIKKNITHFDKEIVTLTECRTRLISDVVTGKIDVRGIDISENASVDMEDDYGVGVSNDTADIFECEK